MKSQILSHRMTDLIRSLELAAAIIVVTAVALPFVILMVVVAVAAFVALPFLVFLYFIS